jgi:MFS family permease
MTTLHDTVSPLDPAGTEAEAGRAPLAVLLAGTFLIVLDFFIVNVALPSMQTDLAMGNTALEWVVAGYGLTFGGLLLVASRLGDRWGRRRLFTTGLVLFVLTSAGCGLATGAESLLVARLLQGAAAAAIAPTVLALIGDVYDGPQRARALGTYATVMGVAAASGQLVGGVLIHADLFGLGWRSIFLVNVPVGLVAALAAPRVLPDTRVAGAARVDVLETVLSAGLLTAAMLPLTEGRQQGWPLWTWLSLAGAVVLAGLLARRSTVLRRRGVRPLVDLDPLRSRPVAMGMAGQAALFTGMASYFLVLALYLQQGRGLGALASGLVFTIVAVSYMVGTSAAPRLAALGGRAVVLGGAVFGAGHLLLLGAVEHVGTGGSVLWLAPGLAVGGLGMGVALAALVGTVMGSVPPQHAGTVSGTASTLQQLGNALGVALVGLVFFGRLDRGIVPALDASLVYLAATTAAVVLVGLLLPRPTR